MPDPILPMDPFGPPGKLVGRACDRYGSPAVVDWCVRLVTGGVERADDPDISWLGGHHGWDPEWTRVWALRALTHTWEPDGVEAVHAGLRDEAWRVQEMALNVVAHRGLDEFADDVDLLTASPEDRVARAAQRASSLLAG